MVVRTVCNGSLLLKSGPDMLHEWINPNDSNAIKMPVFNPPYTSHKN